MSTEVEYSINSAARLLGVHRHTLSSWIHAGRVVRIWRRTPGGYYMIPLTELRRLKLEFSQRRSQLANLDNFDRLVEESAPARLIEPS
jgi:excisionase family DNA binding protein